MRSGERILMLQRRFPSANMALVTGPRPILVDTGFGSDLPETERLLAQLGVPPAKLHLIANTHFHVDHAGGNHGLQQAYGVPVAASAPDAALVNGRHPNACDAAFLDHPVQHYRVDRVLRDGDELDTGEVVLRVLATPGHTASHLSFYAPAERVLVLGDVFHRDDVAWLNLCTDGPDPVEQMLATLDRLARLPVAWACSGHGPRIDDVPAALDAARRRYEKWREQPQKIGWHACKRLFGSALMLEGGMDAERVRAYLLNAPWFVESSRRIFERQPEEFADQLVAEMLRARAARWQDGRLVPLTPYTPVPAGWVRPDMRPRFWPRDAL
ncbi:glyoxylase-like metal-dependent hydrolase (beta-lactamase superfamily II) [Symbiobacterium terraclitae]|uniref:Glyoxylase-like metal-dependent hydrolase (Beta-lactamase superfamily II) n=1 Tax=Symbiobacterium terraclitae TaxID=557451 RepID=A0ABS4JVE7_9FIRM|nr:MBL fold metallo-hydrolase [Symbiobacterium terraclitae]MBP2019527.1 glyoxylase-like metal-dependent hydrolase (beta-lactamase superfamily II) [Symbiobacterium terraclitae]